MRFHRENTLITLKYALLAIAADLKIHWFVMHPLISVKHMEDALKREGLEYFLPKQTVIRQHKSGSRLVQVPILEYYLFIHATYRDIQDFKRKGYYLSFLSDHTQKVASTMKVPDKEMEDFIRVYSTAEQKMRIYSAAEIVIPAGQRIRIRGGVLDGVEGLFVKLKGVREKRLVVSIQGVAHATIPVDKTFIQFIGNESSPPPE